MTLGEPLPDEVIATLEYLLRRGDPLHDALLAQIPHARISSRCGCGCATVYFELGADAMPGPVDPAREPVVAEADIVTADGECPGQILVFVHRGCLSWLEVCSWDEPIATWPPLEQLQPGNVED
jgi:hypothetical protein